MTPTDGMPKTDRRPWGRPTIERLRTAEAAIAPRTVADDGPGTKTS